MAATTMPRRTSPFRGPRAARLRSCAVALRNCATRARAGACAPARVGGGVVGRCVPPATPRRLVSPALAPASPLHSHRS